MASGSRDPSPPPGLLAMALFEVLFLALLAGAHAEIPGCKIRISSKALDLGKARGGSGRVRERSPQQWEQKLRVSLPPQ